MSRITISEQIRLLRKSQGLSQEALAENAGINLRTLQRIETGNAIPRGETLRLLAQALDVSIEELAMHADVSNMPIKEDQGFLKLMNLSALTLWFIPFGNILIPLALWIFKKDVIKGVRELGKRILNFQITWSLITYGLAMILVFLMLYSSVFVHPFLMLFVMLLLYFINSILVITTNRRITRGEEDVYSHSLKIIS